MQPKRTRDRDGEPPALTAEPQAAQAELEAPLAAQGVRPITSMAELRGDFWPEDEAPDEFLATIRAWREGSGRPGVALMASVVVDTDVVSFLLRGDSRGALYEPYAEISS